MDPSLEFFVSKDTGDSPACRTYAGPVKVRGNFTERAFIYYIQAL